MLFSNSLGNPNHEFGIETCSVSRDLSKMVVVSLAELVLYQYPVTIGSTNARNNVGSKISYARLGLFEEERSTPKAECERQLGEVIFLRKPRRKISFLVRPSIANAKHAIQLSKFDGHLAPPVSLARIMHEGWRV